MLNVKFWTVFLAAKDAPKTGGAEAKPQVDRSLAEGDHVKVTSRSRSVDISGLFDESKVTRVEAKQRKRSSVTTDKRQSLKAGQSAAARGLPVFVCTVDNVFLRFFKL